MKPQNELVEVVLASTLPPSLWKSIAQTVAIHSRTESNMLTRSEAYFFAQITANRMFVTQYRGEIIGSVCLHRLSDTAAEIGSAWVSNLYRGKGIYSRLKEAAVQLAKKLELTVVSTAKVTRASPSLSLKSGISRGMLPVPFQYLQQRDRTAYESCCNCGHDRNHLSCPERDKSCVLSVHIANRSDLSCALHFIAGPAWQALHLHHAQKTDICNVVVRHQLELNNSVLFEDGFAATRAALTFDAQH